MGRGPTLIHSPLSEAMSKFATFLGALGPSSSHPRSLGSFGKERHSLSSRMHDMNPVIVSSPKDAKHPVEQVGSPPQRARQESPLRQSLLSAHALKLFPQRDSSAKHCPLMDTHAPLLQGRHGGRSANPPPVSSTVERRVADQCWVLHEAVVTREERRRQGGMCTAAEAPAGGATRDGPARGVQGAREEGGGRWNGMEEGRTDRKRDGRRI